MSKRVILYFFYLTLVIMALALLASCGGNPVYIDRPVTVDKPVAVLCIKSADVPPMMAYPTDTLNSADSDGDIIGALLEDRKQRAKTEQLLRGLIAACTEEL